MAQLDTANKLLRSIRDHTGLYWGNSDHPFTSLVAFLNGYQVGFGVGSSRCRIEPSDLVPSDFHRFVTERFGRRFPAGGKGWQTFIEENTESEEEAFHLFFQLRGQYDKQKIRRAEPTAPPNRRPARARRVRRSRKGSGGSR